MRQTWLLFCLPCHLCSLCEGTRKKGVSEVTLELPLTLQSMAGGRPDPALLPCFLLHWQRKAQICIPPETHSSRQWSPLTYYSITGLYGRCELIQFIWIQELSATDRKINNLGKGGVDKQGLVETDWKDQEPACSAPPTPSAATKHPHRQSLQWSLRFIFHWKGISGKFCFGWNWQLALDTWSFEGFCQRGFLVAPIMKICPALWFHLITKARLHRLHYSCFFAPVPLRHSKLIPPVEAATDQQEAVSNLIPSKDYSAMWSQAVPSKIGIHPQFGFIKLHHQTHLQEAIFSDFCSNNISVTILQNRVRSLRSSHEHPMCVTSVSTYNHWQTTSDPDALCSSSAQKN